MAYLSPDELAGALGVEPCWHGTLPKPRFLRSLVSCLFYRKLPCGGLSKGQATGPGHSIIAGWQTKRTYPELVEGCASIRSWFDRLITSAGLVGVSEFRMAQPGVDLPISGYTRRSLGATKASAPTKATPTTALILAAQGAPQAPAMPPELMLPKVWE